MRVLMALSGLLFGSIGAAACGDEPERVTELPTVTFAVDQATVENRVDRGLSQLEVVELVGPPARVERRKEPVNGLAAAGEPVPKQCYIYGLVDGRATDEAEICFVDGEVSNTAIKQTLGADDEAAAPSFPIPGADPPSAANEAQGQQGSLGESP